VQRLRELGWIEGRTVTIEYRWAESRPERFLEIAAEFARLKVDVIFTAGAETTLAARRTTSDIPIVFALANNPVSSGLVASLGRPGGNVTGLSTQGTDTVGKRLDDIAASFDGIKGRADALYVCVDPLVLANRDRINRLALDTRLPTMHGFREYAAAGGLVSYGPNVPDLFRRSADFVNRIFRGAKPTDIPVEQPTKFDFVINLRTAKALGLTVPDTLLARSDEVIE
jgi:ABC-type uncharacterized transport system substrate-binding protein